MRSLQKNKKHLPRELGWIYLFLLPTFLVFLAFYLVPIITVIATSFTKWDGFNTPIFNGFDNYVRLFTNAQFQQSLGNLLAWALIAMTLHVGYGVLIAFILYRRPFGWAFTQMVFMIPNVISVAAWAMIYRYFFRNDIGILNTLIRLVNPNFNVDWFFDAPFAFWAVTLTWLFYSVIITLLVSSDLLAIPAQLHEAALIDGASPRQIILRIDLPLCRNSIGTGIILSITARIAMFEAIYLTTNGAGDTMNIPVILYRTLLDSKYGIANANGVVMIVLGILTLLLINRLFRMNESVY